MLKSFKFINIKLALLLFFYALFAFCEQDINYEYFGVRSRSLGNTGRGLANSNDAIFYNPAGLKTNPRFNLDGDYAYESLYGHHHLGVSIVDSLTADFGFGLSYQNVIDKKAKIYTQMAHIFGMAISFPVAGPFFLVGLSGTYYIYPKFLENLAHKTYLNGAVGFLSRLPVGISLGASIYDLWPSEEKRKPMSLGIGASYEFERNFLLPLTLAIDWVMHDVASNNDLKHQVSFGGEYLALQVFPFRLGYSFGPRKNDGKLGLGIGFQVPSFSLEAHYAQNLKEGQDRDVGFSLKIYF